MLYFLSRDELNYCLDFVFFKQKTAYVMHISDWSSDVCSSDLDLRRRQLCPGNGSCGLSLSALPERAGSRADDRFARPTRGWFVNYVIAKRKPGAGDRKRVG